MQSPYAPQRPIKVPRGDWAEPGSSRQLLLLLNI